MPNDPDKPLFSENQTQTVRFDGLPHVAGESFVEFWNRALLSRGLTRPFDQVSCQLTSIALVPKGRAHDLSILQDNNPAAYSDSTRAPHDLPHFHIFQQDLSACFCVDCKAVWQGSMTLVWYLCVAAVDEHAGGGGILNSRKRLRNCGAEGIGGSECVTCTEKGQPPPQRLPITEWCHV